MFSGCLGLLDMNGPGLAGSAVFMSRKKAAVSAVRESRAEDARYLPEGAGALVARRHVRVEGGCYPSLRDALSGGEQTRETTPLRIADRAERERRAEPGARLGNRDHFAGRED